MNGTGRKIVVIPGDFAGAEVTPWGVKVIQTVIEATPALSDVYFVEKEAGGGAIDKYGTALPDDTFEACKTATAVFFGSVGGPKWTGASGDNPMLRPEWALLTLRKELQLYANIRPCIFPSKALYDASPLKREIVEGVEFIVLRENAGGCYFGKRQEDNGFDAYDTTYYSVPEIERVVDVAAKLALQHNPPWPVISMEKRNVMASSRLWHRVFVETMKKYPNVPTREVLADAGAMIMMKNPRELNGILVMDNLFGDVLSDEASAIIGSLGLAPSASLNGLEGGPALYEPVHGTAPDIAGQGIANPVASILSGAMLVRYTFGLGEEAKAIERAVERAFDDPKDGGLGLRTRDLGGKTTTTEMGEAVVRLLKEELGKLRQKA
ncbi:3-isopropylmalate dehydrogenase [Hyaloraphidium curvatum]|nr:3-isopropylmalate dehydrogenase [Hyaloraphidium curvatum]